MPKITEHKLIEEFKDRASFTREDLYDFYRFFEPDLSEGTFSWRIYNLKNKNIIRSIKRGLYKISRKPVYKPEVSLNLLKLAKRVGGKFADARHCIWETEWLNEFLKHQSTKRYTIIEIEKEFTHSLYYELKDLQINELFLNPDEKVIEPYIAESKSPVIIKKMITRSPIVNRTENRVKFHTPTLEKILVDLFAEEKLFYHLQGSEMVHIYENALSNYTVNFTKLFSYAKRREREQEIKEFMAHHMYHLVRNVIE